MDLYTPVQAVDFTDTGMWRLVIYISRTGMSAYLKHIEDSSQPVVCLFSERWEGGEAPLLPRIESAVYDHPRLLEDYATDIVLETPLLTWAPTRLLEAADSESLIFSAVFPDAPEDVLTDTTGRQTAIYALCDGLSAFIDRTIPGSRVTSHIGVMVNKFTRMSGESPRIFAVWRGDLADIICITGSKVLSSVTAECHTPEDVAYRIWHMADACNLDRMELKVAYSAPEDNSKQLGELLSLHCGNVEEIASLRRAGNGMPPAVAMMLY